MACCSFPARRPGDFWYFRPEALSVRRTAHLRSLPTRFAVEAGWFSFATLKNEWIWEFGGLSGTEIYNTHVDFKDEKKLQGAMRNPLWIVQAAELFRKYPQESFSSLQ